MSLQTKVFRKPRALCAWGCFRERNRGEKRWKKADAESQEQNEKLQQRKYHFQLQPFNIERNTSVPGLDDLFSDKKIVK